MALLAEIVIIGLPIVGVIALTRYYGGQPPKKDPKDNKDEADKPD